jgi:hypothetical protein
MLITDTAVTFECSVIQRHFLNDVYVCSKNSCQEKIYYIAITPLSLRT